MAPVALGLLPVHNTTPLETVVGDEFSPYAEVPDTVECGWEQREEPQQGNEREQPQWRPRQRARGASTALCPFYVPDVSRSEYQETTLPS